MEQNVERDQRIMWAFGIAAGLAVIGALAPLAFTVGGHTRISGVAIPFGVAAVALAINAVTYHQGRTVAVAVYFVAGLAVVYGILAMLAVPLRLAVVGTCPAAPAHCPSGFEPPLTSGENSGLGTATFCGILAIFIGFYGLVMLYRRARTARTQTQSHAWPAAPLVQPAQTSDAAAAPADTDTAEAAPVSVAEPAPAPPQEPAPTPAADPEPAVQPARKPARRAARKVAPTSSATEELKELPAPEEQKELPPPA